MGKWDEHFHFRAKDLLTRAGGGMIITGTGDGVQKNPPILKHRDGERMAGSIPIFFDASPIHVLRDCILVTIMRAGMDF